MFRIKCNDVPPLLANYHTHTWRCKHANGSEREYVEKAIAAGTRILGFSDHTPYPFPNGYCSSFRMELDKLEGYVTTVEDLRREYARDIEIHLGLEVEYYPAYFEDLLRFLEPYDIEYMLLGQHFIRNELAAPYNGVPCSNPEYLRRYVFEVCEAMKTGHFLCLAHPDLFHYTGPRDIYVREMQPLVETAVSLGIPLEINLLGIQTHRHYPDPDFWAMAGRMGANAILGTDAHDPASLNRPDVLQKGRALAKACHLRLLDTLDLKRD